MSELGVFALVTLPLLALLVYMIVEVVRRRDLSLARRALWVVLLVAVPVVALAVYIVVRPPKAVQRAGGNTDVARAETLVLLAERRQRGELSDEAYRAEVAAFASLD